MYRVFVALSLLCGLLASRSLGQNFETAARPVLSKTCAPCHNDSLSSGGLNINAFATPDSVSEHREGWEMILRKIKTGEMPPKGIPRPPAAQIDASDQVYPGRVRQGRPHVKPDPGRVTARRLNRNEYPNTIRDLLAWISRREGFSDRRFRLRLRQHRRHPHHLARADGEVSRPPPSGSRPGRSAPIRCRKSRSKRNITPRTRPSAAWTSARSRRRIASISTASTTCASACPASAGADAKPVKHGLLDGRQAAPHDAGRNQAVEAGLFQSVLG